MAVLAKNNNVRVRANRPSKSRLQAASLAVIELIESRVLMSTTLATWAFDTLPGTTSVSTIQTSPATTIGSGTAYTVGMQSGTANGYLYPATGANATADASTFLAATGNADSGGNGGSEGGNNGFVWRVESGQDSNAPIASQGVQFNVSTAGEAGIAVNFDMNPSSSGAEAQFAVEYTTGVNDANPVWTNVTQDLTFGSNNLPDPNNSNHVATIGTSSTNDIELQTNSSNPNIISGTYATINGPLVGGSNTAWLNDLVLDLSSSTAVNNSPNFAFRVVNAATGSSETSIAGVAGGTFKNWRFNDITFVANAGNPVAPTITTNPTSQVVAAGQPVSFTAAAGGNPTPTVQWYEGAVGSGTAISGATSNTLTFTTSSTASDNGNTYYAVFTNASGSATTTAATLSDALAAPAITTQPPSYSGAAGNVATFTAAASGSPVPTVQLSGPGT
jgi:hypothetical protein